MKPLECLDFNCSGKDASGKCSTFWLCLVRLADHLAYLSMVVLGCCYFVGVGLIVHANHADPASMTLVTTVTGLFAGMLYTIRQRIDRVEDRKQMKEVADKQDETKLAVENKMHALDQKLEPIKNDVKAAAVASKVAVQQNVELIATTKVIAKDVNGGKQLAVEEASAAAYKQGRDDEKDGKDSKF